MTRTVRAVFDGQALRPEEPIDIKPDTRVTLTIRVAEKKAAGKVARRSFLETALSLKLDGPSDGSRRVEEYLYVERS
ncbi:MAG: antitoxin family protein [Firmicutes bacterium]|nr:antitoxin family protein [Bacillota bacterium]